MDHRIYFGYYTTEAVSGSLGKVSETWLSQTVVRTPTPTELLLRSLTLSYRNANIYQIIGLLTYGNCCFQVP